MRHDDQLLAGFPKTGTTWVRYFLYSLLRQELKGMRGTIDGMNDVMPEFAHPSICHAWEFGECPRIIKTHWPYNLAFRNKNTLLLVRDPRDIVISYYHYASASRSLAFDGSIGDVMRHKTMGIEAFMRHYSSWRRRAGLVVRFEDLKDDPVAQFAQIAAFFGISNDLMRIEAAVKESKIDAMKKAQEQSDRLKNEFSGEFKFVRDGTSAQWENLLTREDLDLYGQLKEQYKFECYA